LKHVLLQLDQDRPSNAVNECLEQIGTEMFAVLFGCR